MKTVEELKVGDVVWWSDVNRRGIQDGVVLKAARKLVSVGKNGRILYVFRKDTLRTNDEYGHQTLIVDLAAHEERKKVNAIRMKIARAYGGSRDISLADAIEAARLLKVDIE